MRCLQRAAELSVWVFAAKARYLEGKARHLFRSPGLIVDTVRYRVKAFRGQASMAATQSNAMGLALAAPEPLPARGACWASRRG